MSMPWIPVHWPWPETTVRAEEKATAPQNIVGLGVGAGRGAEDNIALGQDEGVALGVDEGAAVGIGEGADDGDALGVAVGVAEGPELGQDDGDALDVSFDALDMNMDAYDLGVPRCCGAFTPSTRVVSRNDGSGWFLFRF